MSWEMMIALDGTFHINGPSATDYFLSTERSALLWEFHERQPVEHHFLGLQSKAKRDELTALLLPRLQAHRSEALSDQYEQFFVTNQMIVNIHNADNLIRLWLVKGERPRELEGITLKKR
jgi:hypothetical protein